MISSPPDYADGLSMDRGFRVDPSCLAASRLEDLYGEPRGLDRYIDPGSERPPSFMTDGQALQLAGDVLDQILRTPFRRILVMESGATPLAEICIQLCASRGVELEWDFLKIPRDMPSSLPELIAYHLSPEELAEIPHAGGSQILREIAPQIVIEGMSRKDLLGVLCRQLPKGIFKEEGPLNERLSRLETAGTSLWFEAFRNLLSGTSLAERFLEPFLLFDEYITSGTVISNAILFLSLVSHNPDFRIGCYSVNLANPAGYERIQFALHDLRDRESCFTSGAYPYENRIDLCGSFYDLEEGRFKKTFLEEFLGGEQRGRESLELLASIEEVIALRGLREKVKEHCTIPEVARAISDEDVMRFILWRLARKTGDTRAAAFLHELFEMYGPPWFPLPISFHKDYVSAFEKAAPVIDLSVRGSLAESFPLAAKSILHSVARMCLDRRAEWKRHISELVPRSESFSSRLVLRSTRRGEGGREPKNRAKRSLARPTNWTLCERTFRKEH